MKHIALTLATMVALTACGAMGHPTPTTKNESKMELGNFSVSLAVKDLQASLAFYKKLGFEEVGGEAAQNWLILQNDTVVIGLFQGMFPNNIMTFNPGWHVSGEHPEEFTDVRELQRRLKADGITPTTECDESTTGPASFTLADPDGNVILFDQHR